MYRKTIWKNETNHNKSMNDAWMWEAPSCGPLWWWKPLKTCWQYVHKCAITNPGSIYGAFLGPSQVCGQVCLDPLLPTPTLRERGHSGVAPELPLCFWLMLRRLLSFLLLYPSKFCRDSKEVQFPRHEVTLPVTKSHFLSAEAPGFSPEWSFKFVFAVWPVSVQLFSLIGSSLSDMDLSKHFREFMRGYHCGLFTQTD